MGKNVYLSMMLGCFMPLLILTALYYAPGSPIYLDLDWLWIIQMYALFCGMLAVLSVAFYALVHRGR